VVLTGALNWTEVVGPLMAALIGGASVFAVSRHLRRQELYVEAAQKINDYLDEAAEALKEMGHEGFDEEQAQLAWGALSSAVFHSRRLESDEVKERLRVAEFVLWDMVDAGDRKARFWVNRALSDALNAVVEFMVLPRLWPPRRRLRVLPPHQFPNTVDLYSEIATPKEGSETPNWAALRKWTTQRRRELLNNPEERAAPRGLRRLRLSVLRFSKKKQ
jgi:hypothetical protein